MRGAQHWQTGSRWAGSNGSRASRNRRTHCFRAPTARSVVQHLRSSCAEDLKAAGQPDVNDKGKRYDFRSLRRAFSTTLRACKVDRELREQLMGQASSG